MGTVVFSKLGPRRGASIVAGLVAAALAAALIIPRIGGGSAPEPPRRTCGRVAVRPPPAPVPSADQHCHAALAARAEWRVRQAEALASGMAGELEPGPGWEPAVNNCLAPRR